MMKHYVIELVLVISLGLAFLFIANMKREVEVQKIEVRDTIYVDSVRIQEKTVLKYVQKYDTVIEYITARDTILVNVEIPISHYQYKDTIDSFSVDIKYSGYNACLEDVRVKYQADLQKPVRRQKNHVLGQSIVLGAHVGFGIDRNFQFSPYLGIGVTYGFGYCWKK